MSDDRFGERLAAWLEGQAPAREPAGMVPSERALDIAKAAEAGLGIALATCWGIDPCPLGDDPAAVFDALADSLRAQPIDTSDDHIIGEVALQAAAGAATSLPISLGEAFVGALAAAQAGDVEGLLAPGPGGLHGPRRTEHLRLPVGHPLQRRVGAP